MGTVWLHGASGFGVVSVELGGKPLVAGRSGDLRLTEDMIEKKHARFVLRDGKVFVTPMGRGDVSVGVERISGEKEVAPGDLVLLSTHAVIFVAADVDPTPSKKARDALRDLSRSERDRLLVRLLELPAPKLVALVVSDVLLLPARRAHAVASTLKTVLDRLAERADRPPEDSMSALRSLLRTEKPASAVLADEEALARRRAAEAAAPPPPPIDEDADPELSAGTGTPTRAWNVVPADGDVGHGFSFGVPPIPVAQWPRSRRDGVPMVHLGTLLVPAEYRVGGEGKVAIALFQADDHTRREVEGAPRHEGDAWVMEDEIGGGYALIWLDAPTFAQGQGREVPAGVQTKPPQYLRLRARIGDPSVGAVIPDWDAAEDDAIIPGSDAWEKLDLARYSFQRSKALVHFGGTSMACDNFAHGLGPVYVGVEHAFGGANFGGGNAVIDLVRKETVFGQ
ncbi:FHA domain-containing protein [Chondromyces crocatus]|uniref:FHA domain-containing protein n=1 Tax=Chondromyces crocatus TaxID=52 RepID=A0A0K1ED11_CHOCO|nr:FHA domain-containing protein [Chondromyces crocatus]AKT38562.1 uncharacterized protein CMC5_027090 [Chondromyces crocatus]